MYNWTKSSMAVGTNDDPVNRPNVTHNMTNSTDVRAEIPNSDDLIGKFMIDFPYITTRP